MNERLAKFVLEVQQHADEQHDEALSEIVWQLCLDLSARAWTA